jgi:hypothetical protein
MASGFVDLDRELWVAAEEGKTGTVEALLTAGADVHADDDVALYAAGLNNKTETARVLLEAGADAHRVMEDLEHLPPNETLRLLWEWSRHTPALPQNGAQSPKPGGPG